MAEIEGIGDLTGKLRTVVETAYRRGFEAGRAAARDAILRAVEEPKFPTTASDATPISKPHVTRPRGGKAKNAKAKRAPKGLLADFLRVQLTESPGLTVLELTERAQILEPLIAARSIGNQLRRFDGMLYERDGRRRWYLFGQRSTLEGLMADGASERAPVDPKNPTGAYILAQQEER